MFRPLYDRVLVKRLDPTEKTAGGLWIPDKGKETPVQGTVVAVGSGRIESDGTTKPVGVKVGDLIVFPKFTGNEILLDEVKHLVLSEEDILGIVDP
jgi:chaperonin GroES